MNCRGCGARVPAPGMFCSATTTLICQGRDFIPACGRVLTPDERHWYGESCEQCERDWHERIEAWRKGGADAEIDRVFDTRTPGHTAH